MNEETEPRKSRSHRSPNRLGRNRQKVEQLRKAVFWVLSILVVVAVVLLLNPRTERGGNQVLNQGGLIDRNTQNPDFDLVIREGDVEQLVEFSNSLLMDQSGNEITQLDAIGKRMAISDRILELNPDADSRTFAILTKLRMLLDREHLLVEKGMHSDVRTMELQEFASRYVSFDDESIARLALVGVAVAAISNYLDEGATAERAEMMTAAVGKFTTAAQFSADDPAIATRLYDWLKIVQKRAEKQESHLFSVAWTNCYADSQDNRISSLFDRMANISELSEVDFVDVEESMPGNRDTVIGQLLDQIDVALNQSDVSNATVQFALQRATELLAFGRVDDAKAIQRILEQSAVDSTTEKNSRELTKFDRRLKLFESPFEVASFTDIDSKPVKFSLADAKFRILYFISDLNNDETMPTFTKLIETVRSKLLSSNLEIVVIYLDHGNDSESLEQIRLLAAQNFRWQVWILTLSTAEAQEFLDKLPIEKSPYIVILDNDDRAIALDPSIFQIEETVFAASANENK